MREKVHRGSKPTSQLKIRCWMGIDMWEMRSGQSKADKSAEKFRVRKVIGIS